MIEVVPNWHPIFVHFTVALLGMSVLLHALAPLLPASGIRDEWRTVARWLLWFGAGFAVVTVLTGWLAYNSVEHDEVSHVAMTDHRNWALATLAVFLTLVAWSVWSWWSRRQVGIAFTLLMLAGGGLLASTAWHGAELVFRHGLGVISLPGTAAIEPAPAANADGDSRGGHEAGRPVPRAAAKPAHDHSTHSH
ncbi:MAG TPA: DUF2231 domain-containing protein [Acidiferrobacterales bacterium]|jgi:uncharacterized membrane protein